MMVTKVNKVIKSYRRRKAKFKIKKVYSHFNLGGLMKPGKPKPNRLFWLKDRNRKLGIGESGVRRRIISKGLTSFKTVGGYLPVNVFLDSYARACGLGGGQCSKNKILNEPIEIDDLFFVFFIFF